MSAAGPKDFWDKVAIVVHPLGGLLIGVAVAGVGYMGSDALNRRQTLDTNARLYSELMSRREESESSLRKDMFVSIIQNFLTPKEGDLDSKVLNLELLAYNFHDSLNLKPLFLDISRRIQKLPTNERTEYLVRVNRVAREIIAKQLFSLEGHGKSFRRSVDLDAVRSTPGGLALDGESIRLGGKGCDVSLRALKSDPDQQQITVRLEIKAPNDSPDQVDTRATFDVSWFDFPMIDNTRLANGLRCAVTLAAFSPSSADLATVCFPGEYASLKDRPYYDEVIQKLQEAAREETPEKR
jgi:hypothetical protein